MATLFVASGGSNTSPYDTWAKAATSIQTALTAAAAGDVVVIQYDGVPSGDAEVSSSKTWTFHDGWTVSASNDGGSAYTPTVMGTSYWLGNSTTNRSLAISAASAARSRLYGLTFRTAGSGYPCNLQVGSNGHLDAHSCRFWHGWTSATSPIIGNAIARAYFNDCAFTVANTSNSWQAGGATTIFENCSFSLTGTVPTVLFTNSSGIRQVKLVGCDLSAITTTLFNTSLEAYVERCVLGSGVVVVSAATAPAESYGIWVLDCHVGDTHMEFGYYNGLGSLTKDTGVYYTTTGASWKIVTTSYASSRNPFTTPWIDKYNDTLSSMTPYFEVLRDGSTTAWKDHELWAEFSAKTTSGNTKASFYNDRVAFATYVAGTAGSNQATGAGAGSWTGEGGSIWSGKCDSGSAFTPAEIGYLRGRIAFGVASATLYIDPVIRT